ncbi:NolW domain-containing protein [Marinobacter santoriniensis NKSG1]|uniref:NolW domain-containing protein n=1 Tax=Marinobacter santoriniensis NKSG1 TaxID=1288826 RepID=M7CSF2_9GAMM|nr:secretin N-terminal domain-containing protein [Marinobacter santoriniensis]EMP55065.1 NolW domain-containing protein [Marinobacter santoriniensis NKSG1]
MNRTVFPQLRLLLVLIVTVPLWLAAASAQAQTETRIYQLTARTGDDVATQIRDLYQDSQITVTARGQQLVVRGEPRLLDEIGTLVQSLDVAPAQIRITVRTREDIGGKESGGGVSGNDKSLRIEAQNKVITTANQAQRTIIVQDGQTAQITSGQVRTLPFAIRGGRNPATILEQVKTHSGFLVSPQVISDQTVELNIVSFEEDPAQIQGYDTEALLTIRRVEPGHWVSLGSVDTSNQSANSDITYTLKSNQSRSRIVDVKVDILR